MKFRLGCNTFFLRFICVIILITIIILYINNNTEDKKLSLHNALTNDTIYLWCTFTQVKNENTAMKAKFHSFISSLKKNTVNTSLSLNIVIDTESLSIAEHILSTVFNENISSHGQKIEISYHHIDIIASQLEPMINIMKQHFTQERYSYYANALFFISLGLHKVVPLHQNKIILVDVDMEFRAPLSQLYQHFNNFKSSELFGIAVEQSPLYINVLKIYRKANKKTKLGSAISEHGNPGYNSGVVLIDIEKLRLSEVFENVTTPSYVQYLVSKYTFQGYLGDQDFYTVLSFEHPELIYTLPCQWNKQLCIWWKYHGFKEIFDKYYDCPEPIYVYHGNCNTSIPQQ